MLLWGTFVFHYLIFYYKSKKQDEVLIQLYPVYYSNFNQPLILWPETYFLVSDVLIGVPFTVKPANIP